MACENEKINLFCHPGYRIAIYSATYGRTEYESLQCPQPVGVTEESKYYFSRKMNNDRFIFYCINPENSPQQPSDETIYIPSRHFRSEQFEARRRKESLSRYDATTRQPNDGDNCATLKCYRSRFLFIKISRFLALLFPSHPRKNGTFFVIHKTSFILSIFLPFSSQPAMRNNRKIPRKFHVRRVANLAIRFFPPES